jgi:serine/arginine repetitive matrix protein 2
VLPLGFKTVLFSRSGPSALLYSGLPLSSPIVIKRSFMCDTFQVAFMNHQSPKRRYMFSVDDPIMRHSWMVLLKHQIDIVSAGQQVQVAFRVLQEMLIPPPSVEGDYPCPTFSSCAQRLSPRSNSRLEASGKGTSQSSHVWSKSRSQVYHHHGPGKLEHQ